MTKSFNLKIKLMSSFSILGMNLFGCKFCEDRDDEKVCDRKNFDTLLWSLVTVFQVIIKNATMINYME
jgi:voltage-dependent calcium channel T type alpha-1G